MKVRFQYQNRQNANLYLKPAKRIQMTRQGYQILLILHVNHGWTHKDGFDVPYKAISKIECLEILVWQIVWTIKKTNTNKEEEEKEKKTLYIETNEMDGRM